MIERDCEVLLDFDQMPERRGKATRKRRHTQKDLSGYSVSHFNIGSAPPPIDRRLSPIETLFSSAWSLACSDIPLEQQHKIAQHRVDYAHLETRTVIELDGLESHSTTSDIARDCKRQRDLTRRGWLVVRFGGLEVHHNVQAVVNEARELIQQRLPRQDKENLHLALTSLIAEVQELAVRDELEAEEQRELAEYTDQYSLEECCCYY